MFLCKIVVCCKSHKLGGIKQCRKELSLITAGEEGYYEIKKKIREEIIKIHALKTNKY